MIPTTKDDVDIQHVELGNDGDDDDNDDDDGNIDHVLQKIQSTNMRLRNLHYKSNMHTIQFCTCCLHVHIYIYIYILYIYKLYIFTLLIVHSTYLYILSYTYYKYFHCITKNTT